jgi:hypothetical protein
VDYVSDVTRLYRPAVDANGATRSDGGARPIRVSLWYPSASAGGRPLRFKDYVLQRQTELEPRALTEQEQQQALDAYAAFIEPMWGYPGSKVQHRLFPDGLPPSAVSRMMATPVAARGDAPAAPGRYPVLLFFGPTDEQSVLFEYLASHGFLVAAIPDIGVSFELDQQNRPDAATRTAFKTRDLAFLLDYAKRLPNAKATAIAGYGGGAGRLPVLRLQIETAALHALLLQADGLPPNLSTDEIVRLRAPILAVVSGDTHVMDPEGAAKFPAQFEAARFSDRLILRFERAGHPELAVFRRAGTPDSAATEHRVYDDAAMYILRFLQGSLQADAAARAFLERTPEENGIPTGEVTMRRLRAEAGALHPRVRRYR